MIKRYQILRHKHPKLKKVHLVTLPLDHRTRIRIIKPFLEVKQRSQHLVTFKWTKIIIIVNKIKLIQKPSKLSHQEEGPLGIIQWAEMVNKVVLNNSKLKQRLIEVFPVTNWPYRSNNHLLLQDLSKNYLHLSILIQRDNQFFKRLT